MVHRIVRRCRRGSAYGRIRRGRPAGHARQRPLLKFGDVPAGQLCDFNYRQSFRVVDHFTVFGDPDNATRAIDHLTEYVTHTNLDTGYTLTEVDHVTETFNAGDQTLKDVGLFWHLRTPAGKVVVVHAGQTLLDLATGEFVKLTPNSAPDLAAVVCPALGGNSS